MYSSSKFFAIGATLAVLASVGVSAPAIATETDSGALAVCSSGTRTLFRQVGHPGKSMQSDRREVSVPRRCAASASNALVLASFNDATGGGALIAGRPQSAIEQIGSSRKSSVTAEVLTNLCVAHTVARDWSQAPDACDAAVAAALDERSRNRDWPGTRFQRAKQALAVAYSNRAVMHWLSDDMAASGKDLALARTISPKARFVVKNTELTSGAPSHAQARLVTGPMG
jgi:hypothetical protein